MHHILRRFMPAAQSISVRERVRTATGAFLGICATGLIGTMIVGPSPAVAGLVAPMGASAVLLFAVPSSPLAQPWSILGGNTVAAIIGVTAASWIGNPVVAAGVAIGAAIAVMMALRCLHPPSGAIALTAVLGGPAIHDLGYGFVLWPVAGNSLLLLTMALIYNNMSGHAYPHVPKPAAPAPHGTADPAPMQRIGFARTDLEDVLRDHDEFIDINRDDLETILRQTELRALRRRGNHVVCASVMSRDVVAVTPDTSVRRAQELMQAHHFRALPVVNQQNEVVGIVTQTDLLRQAFAPKVRGRNGILQRLGSAASGARAGEGAVQDIMTSPVTTVAPNTLLADAIIILADSGLHDLPVVDSNNKLAGILSQSDMLAALLADQAG